MPKRTPKKIGLLYEELGLDDKNVSTDFIYRAFKRQSVIHHPDKNFGNPIATDKQKAITVARDVLTDKNRKARYDQNPLFWDKKIFGENLDGIPSVPKEIDEEVHDFSNFSTYSDIHTQSFNELCNKLLTDYGHFSPENEFVFNKKCQNYVNKFNILINTVTSILNKSLNDSLLSVMYASLWLLTIMEKDNFVFLTEPATDENSAKLLKNIFDSKEIQTSLSSAAKLIKQNGFLSRILLLQHLHKQTVDQAETQTALKFGLGQMYYRTQAIKEAIQPFGIANNSYIKSSALLKGSLFLGLGTAAAITVFTPALFFSGTLLVPMTVLGALATCLMASTLLIGAIPTIALVGLTIAAAVHAKKFGTAIEKEKYEIHREVKIKTQEHLRQNSNTYNFFQQKVCAVATKLESNTDVSNNNKNIVLAI